MIDDDLASVLSNVAADARPATRTKIANSAETRAFLEIGLLLLRDRRRGKHEDKESELPNLFTHGRLYG